MGQGLRLAVLLAALGCADVQGPVDVCPGQETWTHAWERAGVVRTDTLCLPRGTADLLVGRP